MDHITRLLLTELAQYGNGGSNGCYNSCDNNSSCSNSATTEATAATAAATATAVARTAIAAACFAAAAKSDYYLQKIILKCIEQILLLAVLLFQAEDKVGATMYCGPQRWFGQQCFDDNLLSH